MPVFGLIQIDPRFTHFAWWAEARRESAAGHRGDSDSPALSSGRDPRQGGDGGIGVGRPDDDGAVPGTPFEIDGLGETVPVTLFAAVSPARLSRSFGGASGGGLRLVFFPTAGNGDPNDWPIATASIR